MNKRVGHTVEVGEAVHEKVSIENSPINITVNVIVRPQTADMTGLAGFVQQIGEYFETRTDRTIEVPCGVSQDELSRRLDRAIEG